MNEGQRFLLLVPSKLRDITEYKTCLLDDIRQGELPTKEERQRLLQGFIAAEHVNLERIEHEVPANDTHDYNDVPRPHGHHVGHHGHSHTGFKLGEDEDQYQVDTTGVYDVYEYYDYDGEIPDYWQQNDYDGEIPDYWQQYYSEYEDELEEKIEETKKEDEGYYEHQGIEDDHMHVLQVGDESEDGKVILKMKRKAFRFKEQLFFLSAQYCTVYVSFSSWSKNII